MPLKIFVYQDNSRIKSFAYSVIMHDNAFFRGLNIYVLTQLCMKLVYISYEYILL